MTGPEISGCLAGISPGGTGREELEMCASHVTESTRTNGSLEDTSVHLERSRVHTPHLGIVGDPRGSKGQRGHGGT